MKKIINRAGLACAVLIPASARRYPLVAFAFAWYLVAHALESSIVPLEMVYEHRNYSAMMGFAMLLADALWSVTHGRRVLLGAATFGLVGILAIPLAPRASLWGDEMALAADQLKHHPESLRSRYHFANLHLRIADAATDPEAQRRAVLVAEHYNREMLEIDSKDIVAIATLFYIDGRYFGGARHQQILVELLDASDKPVFVEAGPQRARIDQGLQGQTLLRPERPAVRLIVEGVARRTNVSPAVPALMRAAYAAEVSNDAGAAVTMLRTAGANVADDSAVQKLLLTWELQSGDLPGAMETARGIYARDRSNAQLALLRRATTAMQEPQ